MNKGKLSMDALFNTKAITEKSEERTPFFKPNPKNYGGKYNAVIRFIPNVRNLEKSIIDVYTCYLKRNERDKFGKFINKKQGGPCPITEMFFKLREHPNPFAKEKSKMFSSSRNFYSLIRVIKDDQHPENEGRILVWRYGVKVWDKINNEENPLIGKSVSPFNAVEGRVFSVQTKIVSNFPNYDDCQFVNVDDPAVRLFEPDKHKSYTDAPAITATEEGARALVDYINQYAPVLEEFDYKDWTDEEIQYVDEVIVSVMAEINGERVPKPTQTAVKRSYAKPATSKPAGYDSSDLPFDDGFGTTASSFLPDTEETDFDTQDDEPSEDSFMDILNNTMV